MKHNKFPTFPVCDAVSDYKATAAQWRTYHDPITEQMENGNITANLS